MSALKWVVGLAVVGAAVVGGIAIASASDKKKTAPGKPASRLTKGERYQFVAQHGPGQSPRDVFDALVAAGWGNPIVCFYGGSCSFSATWPPLADKSRLYAARAMWILSDAPIPSGLMGLQQLPGQGDNVGGAGDAVDSSSPWRAWHQSWDGGEPAHEDYVGPSEGNAAYVASFWIAQGYNAGFYRGES